MTVNKSEFSNESRVVVVGEVSDLWLQSDSDGLPL